MAVLNAVNKVTFPENVHQVVVVVVDVEEVAQEDEAEIEDVEV